MGASAARKTLWVELGIEGYLEIWDLQRELWELRISREIPDVVLVVEHLPCITWGGGARPEHILAEQYELDQAGIPVHGTDRGGGVSYHGPGQVVIYPILDLGDYGRDVHVHVRRLEEVMIRVSAAAGLHAFRDPAFPGIWGAGGKLGAVGVSVRRWVTMHGAALNVCPCMAHFELIVPCGITHRPVTSLEKMLEHPVSVDVVRRQMRDAFCDVFGGLLEDVEAGDVYAYREDGVVEKTAHGMAAQGI